MIYYMTERFAFKGPEIRNSMYNYIRYKNKFKPRRNRFRRRKGRYNKSKGYVRKSIKSVIALKSIELKTIDPPVVDLEVGTAFVHRCLNIMQTSADINDRIGNEDMDEL